MRRSLAVVYFGMHYVDLKIARFVVDVNLEMMFSYVIMSLSHLKELEPPWASVDNFAHHVVHVVVYKCSIHVV